jgi:dipeptidyl aminopeptidase/acylaminoacyl peptidase
LPHDFKWSGDSKHLLMVADKGGDENTHIYVGSADDDNNTTLTDLTPFDNTVAQIVRVVDDGPHIVAIENRRDKKVFDLFSIDITTGKHIPLATNPGTVAKWGVDRHGKLLARVLQDGERQTLQTRQPGTEESWKSTAEWTTFDETRLIDFTEDGKAAWILSNRGRDKVALVKMNLADGRETVVYADPAADVEEVLLSRKTRLPMIAYSDPDYPNQSIFNTTLRERLSALTDGKPARIEIESVDDADRNMTVSVITDRGTRHYLYSAESAKPVLLGEDSLSRLAPQLATIQPISFTSRDGLTLNGYLTLPSGLKPEKLPMVVLVHGGPWARDLWGGNKKVQFLANRGYAVLQVNYRGSTGYGRAFLEKSAGEFAGKMHDDLIDGVNWAVESGIADRARIAIDGASYGGYAALVGLTFTPDVFACGISHVGVSDLARLLDTAPEYWELGKPWWKRFIGDSRNPEDRKIMDSKSPLYKADAVTKPLLIMHGVNDPRVKLEQSELMVAALKKAGKQVDFVTFSGDGHGNQRWPNNLTMYRKTEDFLANCLGGRSSGFDFYQLGSWAF